MDGIRNVVCVICPRGCTICVKMNEGKINEITGNRCKRGFQYATAECTAPVRTLTTTVRVTEGHIPMCPVRTSSAVPKELLPKCMTLINGCILKAPVSAGEIIIKDILGTGADIVSTAEIRKDGVH